ncbi:cadherin [Culex quinquefasciatus]|uniref:Cadherin n=1 Tax=Culex quinquefasciatus TaxID=7176 RepID=B0XJ09_CULQU|nr:cadherin [Culex quinquefasciatus]|eukprot:XP_001869631.1 cadherin [Culex quinquefasciatus]
MGSEGEDVAAKLDAAVRMFMQQFTETKTLRKGSKRSKPISKQSDAAADALNIRVDTVSHAIDNLERCDDLIVSGILFVDGEDLSAMFKAMLRHIGLGESAPSSVDIRRLYPRSPSENNSSFIKNQFALRNARDDFYYAYLWKHDLKLCHLGIDSTRRVYVNESLTDAARCVLNMNGIWPATVVCVKNWLAVGGRIDASAGCSGSTFDAAGCGAENLAAGSNVSFPTSCALGICPIAAACTKNWFAAGGTLVAPAGCGGSTFDATGSGAENRTVGGAVAFSTSCVLGATRICPDDARWSTIARFPVVVVGIGSLSPVSTTG